MWNHVLMHLASCVADKVGEKVGAYVEGSRFTIVATGQRGAMQWVAVPYAQARAFKAAYPKAGTAELFFEIHAGYRRKDPEAFRAMGPFAEQVAEAVEAYDGCVIFVVYRGN